MRVKGTSGYPAFPPRWEGGFYMRFRAEGRMIENGFEMHVSDIANPTPVDFGTFTFRRVTANK